MRRGNRIHGTEDLRIFVGPSRVVYEAVDGRVHFRCGIFGSGAREFCGEFGVAGLQHFCGAVEDLAAEVGARFCPAGLCFAGCDDGVAEVFSGGEAVVAKALAIGRERGDDTSAFAAREFAADGEFVGF